jgi:hypothetical protein
MPLPGSRRGLSRLQSLHHAVNTRFEKVKSQASGLSMDRMGRDHNGI